MITHEIEFAESEGSWNTRTVRYDLEHVIAKDSMVRDGNGNRYLVTQSLFDLDDKIQYIKAVRD